MNYDINQIPPGMLEKVLEWVLAHLNPSSWFRRKPKTLHFHCERASWNAGTVGGKDAAQFSSHWRVTNTTDEPFELWSLKVKLPLMKRQSHKTLQPHLFVRNPYASDYSSRHPILPHSTSEVSVGFWVIPPLKDVGKDVRLTIAFCDQFNRYHKKGGTEFAGLQPSVSEAEPVPESIHALGGQLEKDVVSILKSEIVRYRANGRPQGGLGSFAIVVDGRRMSSGFADWRRVGTGIEQSIVQKSIEVQIESDNFGRLETLFAKQRSGEEQKAFRKLLLDRVSADCEYAPVTYLIVWFFLINGSLSDCLNRVKQAYSGSAKYALGKWALSDSLRLLDLMLQYQPSLFDDHRLEQLEAFIGNVQEHAFHIRERIAAIRASRIE